MPFPSRDGWAEATRQSHQLAASRLAPQTRWWLEVDGCGGDWNAALEKWGLVLAIPLPPRKLKFEGTQVS